MTTMKILSITLLKTHNTDLLRFEVDLPSGIWPYKGNAAVKMEVAAGNGEDYVEANFPGVKLKVVDTVNYK